MIGKATKQTLWLLIICLLFSTGAYAETFGVYTPEPEGYAKSDAAAVKRLLISELEQNPKATVVNLPADEKCTTKECAKQALPRLGADALIVSSLVKLGDKTLFIVDVVREQGSANYRITASGLGELDRLMPRLVESIIAKKEFEETATVGTVSEKEQKTYAKKVEGDVSWGPALGVLVPVADSYGGEVPTLLGVLLDFRYEIAHWGFEVETGLYFNDQTTEYNSAVEWPLDFSAMYFLSESANSAFFGGSLGIHYIALSDLLTDDEKEENEREMFIGRVKAAASGDASYKVDKEKDEYWGQFAPSISAFAGYEFLRTHTFHMTVKAGYRYNIAELDGNGAHGPFLNLGFTFGHNQ